MVRCDCVLDKRQNFKLFLAAVGRDTDVDDSRETEICILISGVCACMLVFVCMNECVWLCSTF